MSTTIRGLVVSTDQGGLGVAIDPARVLEACALRGWSAARLGREAGLSRPTIRAVFRGHRVRPRTLWRIASALGRGEVPNAIHDLVESP